MHGLLVRWISSITVMLLLAAALTAQTGPRPISLAAGDSLETLVVELKILNVGSETVTAFRRNDDALVPLSPLLTLGAVAFERRTPQDFRITMGTARTVEIDANTSRVRVNGTAVAVAAGAIVVRDGETYIASRFLATMLGVHIETSWRELRVTASGERAFPAQAKAVRNAERFITPVRVAPARLLGTRMSTERPLLDGLVIDYAITTPFASPFNNPGYSLAAGATLLGGSLEGSVASAGSQTISSGSWTGVWRDHSWLTQLRLGDVPSTGPMIRELRGFSITNAPFIRPLIYGDAEYGAQLGPGWDVESYLNGQLIGLDSTGKSGKFSLRLPVDFGSNPVDFIAYGPYGEQQRFSQLFQVFPQDFLPARRVEYGVSYGQCEAPSRCSNIGNVDVRAGLTSRVSVQGGMALLRSDSAGSIGRLYAGASLNPTNSLFLQAQLLQGARESFVARWQPSVEQSLSFDLSRLHDTPAARALTNLSGDRYGASYFVRPSFGAGRTYFTFDASRTTATDGTHDRARFGVGAQLAQSQVLPFIEVDRDHSEPAPPTVRTSAGLSFFLLPRRPLGPVIGQLFAYGALARASDGTQTSSLTFVRQAGNRVRIELGGQWASSGTRANYTLRMLADLPGARVISSASLSGGTGSNYVAGAILADPHAKTVSFVPGPVLRRAGIEGRVYLDANANGRFDKDELPIIGALVRAGPAYALTDSSGFYHFWDLPPFEPVAVAVDVSSLDSPLWVSTTPRAVFEPWPNRFETFDVPVLLGGVVEGVALDQRNAFHPLAGLRVQMVEDGGERTLEATTFSDGAYSFLGVTPGKWHVRVDPRDLQTLRGAALPVPVTVRSMENGDHVAGLTIHVTAPGATP